MRWVCSAPPEQTKPLYGSTTSGGGFGDGELYKIGADGSAFQLLHSFRGGFFGDGSLPEAAVTAVGDVLYGSTENGGTHGNHGTLYSIGLDGTNYQVLHLFGPADPANGQHRFAAMTLVDSTLYGTTINGGGPLDDGTIYTLTVPEPSGLTLG